MIKRTLEQRISRLEKLVSHNEGEFIRSVNTNKPIKFNKTDFENVSFITLYFDGDDIDSIETVGRGTVEVLKQLMLELKSHVNSNIKGIENLEFPVWLEFYDENENMILRSDLPTIYTDSKGNVQIEFMRRRGISSVDKLCLDMFDKYCLI